MFTATGLKEGTAWSGCDQIWRWDTTVNKWAKYAYYKKPRTSNAPAWKKYDYSAATPTFNDLTASDVIRPGETFLYIHNNSGSLTLTLSGQVKPLTNAVGYSFTQGDSRFIAYPWPIAIKISELSTVATWSGLKEGTAWSGCDQIWRWDASVNKWAKYAYYKKPRTSNAPAWKKYNYSAATPTFDDVTNEDIINAGEGFLYIHNNSGEMSIVFNALESSN